MVEILSTLQNNIHLTNLCKLQFRMEDSFAVLIKFQAFLIRQKCNSQICGQWLLAMILMGSQTGIVFRIKPRGAILIRHHITHGLLNNLQMGICQDGITI